MGKFYLADTQLKIEQNVAYKVRVCFDPIALGALKGTEAPLKREFGELAVRAERLIGKIALTGFMITLRSENGRFRLSRDSPGF